MTEHGAECIMFSVFYLRPAENAEYRGEAEVGCIPVQGGHPVPFGFAGEVVLLLKKNIYSLCIVIGACLWGFMGVFRRTLGGIGLDSFGIVLVRCAVATLCFGVLMLFKDKNGFRVKLRDFWCFIGSGIISLLFFTVCYFQAMTLMSLSVAAILLYTAPCFVLLLSAPLFAERLTPLKLLSVALAFGGCVLVSGVIGSGAKLSTIGLLYGLGSGFTYALYSIFGKLAMKRGYGSLTVNFYSCLLAAVGAGLIWGLREPVGIMFASAENLLLCTAAGIMTCFLPYLFYTFGLTGTEAGRASVMASVEPVVATLVGYFIYSEKLDLYGIAGIVLVLAAVFLANAKSRADRKI